MSAGRSFRSTCRQMKRNVAVNERFDDVPPLSAETTTIASAKSMNRPDGFRLACISGRAARFAASAEHKEHHGEMDAAGNGQRKRLRTTSRISAPACRPRRWWCRRWAQVVPAAGQNRQPEHGRVRSEKRPPDTAPATGQSGAGARARAEGEQHRGEKTSTTKTPPCARSSCPSTKALQAPCGHERRTASSHAVTMTMPVRSPMPIAALQYSSLSLAKKIPTAHESTRKPKKGLVPPRSATDSQTALHQYDGGSGRPPEQSAVHLKLLFLHEALLLIRLCVACILFYCRHSIIDNMRYELREKDKVLLPYPHKRSLYFGAKVLLSYCIYL